MDILQFSHLGEGGIIIAGEEKKEMWKEWMAHFVFDRDQIRDVYRQYARGLDDPITSRILPLFPEKSPEKPESLKGEIVVGLRRAIEIYGRCEIDEPLEINARTHEVVYAFLLSKDPLAIEGLLGWKDKNNHHRVVVFYSKEQGRHFLDRLEWQSNAAQQRRRESLAACSLLPTTTLDPFEFPSSLAEHVNTAFLLRHSLGTNDD